MAKTAEQVTDKWVRRAQATQPDYLEGVKNVTVSPTAEAAKKLDKAQMNYNEAITSGRMKRRLEAVSKESWITSTVIKGGARFSGGVAAGKEKMGVFMRDFLPFAQSVSEEIARMPDVTLEDAKQRVLAAMDKLHAYRDRR